MVEKNMNDKQLRIEHAWAPEHVKAYLKDGLAYTIHLKDENKKITDAVFHYCTLFGKHYFAVGASIFPIEQVYSHSLNGHQAPPEPEPAPESSDPNLLVITEDCETIEVLLDPIRTPVAYQRKVRELVEIAGMTEEEARHYLLQPIVLELFYDYGLGLFAVESEAVDASEIFSPYTGVLVPKEDDEEEEDK